MFRKLLGGKSAPATRPAPAAPPPEPTVPSADLADATDANPRLVEYGGDLIAASHAEELRRGDWPAIEAFLAEQTDSELRDWYVDQLVSSTPDRPAWIDEWVAARPGQYIPLLFSGFHKVCWAWEARGGTRAKYVQQDSWAIFFERLHMAQEDLEAAAGLAPAGEAGAFVFMIPMAKGLQMSKAEVMAIYAEAQQRRPWHQMAHTGMVQALAKKWSGSVEMMLDFARTTRNSPVGSGAPVALLSAHFEAAAELGEKEYWPRPDVAPDIIWVADQLAASPARDASALSLGAHNLMLYEFNQMHDVGRAMVELPKVRGRLTFPFNYFKSPGSQYSVLLRKYFPDLAQKP